VCLLSYGPPSLSRTTQTAQLNAKHAHWIFGDVNRPCTPPQSVDSGTNAELRAIERTTSTAVQRTISPPVLRYSVPCFKNTPVNGILLMNTVNILVMTCIAWCQTSQYKTAGKGAEPRHKSPPLNPTGPLAHPHIIFPPEHSNVISHLPLGPKNHQIRVHL